MGTNLSTRQLTAVTCRAEIRALRPSATAAVGRAPIATEAAHSQVCATRLTRAAAIHHRVGAERRGALIASCMYLDGIPDSPDATRRHLEVRPLFSFA